MNKKNMDRFIEKKLQENGGGDQRSTMKLVADTVTGKSEIVIEYTISKRVPITEIEKSEELYKRLTDGHGFGRRVYSLDEIANEKLVNIKDKV